MPLPTGGLTQGELDDIYNEAEQQAASDLVGAAEEGKGPAAAAAFRWAAEQYLGYYRHELNRLAEQAEAAS